MSKTQNIKELPSPEVREPKGEKKRKYHTAEYKLRILKEADLCKDRSGAIGELLRREGLYSSSLTAWRKERDSGALTALAKVRGRKPKYSPMDLKVEQQEKEIRRLQEKLRQANLIIEAQKKISEILGMSASIQSDGELP